MTSRVGRPLAARGWRVGGGRRAGPLRGQGDWGSCEEAGCWGEQEGSGSGDRRRPVRRRGDRRGAVRHGGGRLERRLHGARDLRRRRQPRQQRERQDRRRQGRHGGHCHADPERQGGRHAEHRKPGLPELPRRRHLHDRTAGADRREVRQLPAHPAARGRGAAAAVAAPDPGRPGRRGSVSAAGDQHRQPGRRGPAQRHRPPAREPAPDDHPQRTRHRPRRSRQRPQRGPASLQPGAAGTGKGTRDPRLGEQGARQPRRRRQPGADAARARTQAVLRILRAEHHRRRSDRSPQRRAGHQPARIPDLHARGAPLPQAPRSVRRTGDPDLQRPRRRRAGHQPDVPQHRTVLDEYDTVLQEPRRLLGKDRQSDSSAPSRC